MKEALNEPCQPDTVNLSERHEPFAVLFQHLMRDPAFEIALHEVVKEQDAKYLPRAWGLGFGVWAHSVCHGLSKEVCQAELGYCRSCCLDRLLLVQYPRETRAEIWDYIVLKFGIIS